MIIRNRAKILARKRYGDAYTRLMCGDDSRCNDWKFIWSGRTFFEKRRSWIQRIICW